jgi:hypothetical protein
MKGNTKQSNYKSGLQMIWWELNRGIAQNALSVHNFKDFASFSAAVAKFREENGLVRAAAKDKAKKAQDVPEDEAKKAEEEKLPKTVRKVRLAIYLT